ncbi:peptidase M15 [Sphingomonas sinipercae]|uniref:Peptidase M15 n=1 Tax=Sphingomonas sinipercae TaxID=2714944 RepID=A0A6G7ZL86_9SPHN|nr:D-Ala-D-Ala carboxypeptidase family metallohydrolase [Sphingomonas sinipercae]QIL01744.1 peptidase M15 [Sphingomonas sinipercae]
MRLPVTLSVLIACAAPAQAQQAYAPAWQPTAAYVTAGQDEPGYRSWYMAAPWRAAQVKSFNDYLTYYGVGGVVPTWQLLRTASQWQPCGAEPFEVAPVSEWPNLVQTLRYIRDRVIPAVGPVEPVSVYRNPQLNICAGGARESAHRYMQAVDMVPLRPITREALMHDLCALHAHGGESYQVGLGFYAFLRFHIDSRKFRKWGFAGSSDGVGCGPVATVARTTVAAAPAPATPTTLPDPLSPTPK